MSNLPMVIEEKKIEVQLKSPYDDLSIIIDVYYPMYLAVKLIRRLEKELHYEY